MTLTPKVRPDPGTVIAEDTLIRARIEIAEPLLLLGRVVGEVTSSARVVIEPSGVIRGSLTAKEADIAGVVIGSVTIAERVHFRSSACLVGELIAGRITVEAGAALDAQVAMSSATRPSPQKRLEGLSSDRPSIASLSVEPSLGPPIAGAPSGSTSPQTEASWSAPSRRQKVHKRKSPAVEP